MGLLSHTISVQKPQESIPLILKRRGRKNKQRGRRGRQVKGDVLLVWVAGAGVREREGGAFVVPTHSRLND